MIIAYKRFGWRKWVRLKKEDQCLYIVRYRYRRECGFQRFTFLDGAYSFYDQVIKDFKIAQSGDYENLSVEDNDTDD